jgi:hypothetical protein
MYQFVTGAKIMGTVQASLSKRLDRHFLACAAAAVAVGAAEQSWAVIQYSGPQNIVSNTSNSFGTYVNFETNSVQNGVTGAPGFDLNVFSYRNEYPTGSGNFYPFVATYTGGGANNKVMGSGTYGQHLTRLSAGQSIDGTGLTTANFGFAIYGNPNLYGDFSPTPATGFIGLKFQTADNSTHFGWMRISIGDATGPSGPETSRYPLTIVDWAYETTPNTPIAAGATGAVPEPASAALGMLAIGALGSRAWRKKSV